MKKNILLLFFITISLHAFVPAPPPDIGSLYVIYKQNNNYYQPSFEDKDLGWYEDTTSSGQVALNTTQSCYDYGGLMYYTDKGKKIFKYYHYIGNSYYEVFYTVGYLYCEGATCPDGMEKNADGACVAPSCQPLSSQTVDIPVDSCSGPVTDLDSGYRGTLSYQECDSTCYVLESQNLTCKDFYANPDSLKIIDASKQACDTDLNDWQFNCIEGSPYSLTSSCTPKNANPVERPCPPLEEAKKAECESLGMEKVGKCEDNGLVVTKNTLDCEPIVPDCSSKWHEVFNSTTNTCECAEGFVRNTFGDCWKPLFPDDTNLTNEQQAQQNKAEQDNHAQKTLDETQDNQIESQNDTNEKLDNLGNSLAGIRSDLNTTNNLLNKLADNSQIDMNTTNALLSSALGVGVDIDDSDIDNMTDFFSSITSQYEDFYSNVNNQIGEINSQYDNLKAMLEGGMTRTFTMQKGSSSGCFVIEAFGTTTELKLCDYFSQLSPVIYFVMTAFIMFSILMFNIKYMMRSFE